MTKDCDAFREDEYRRRKENGTVREGLSEIDHPIATKHVDIELSTVALCFDKYESQPGYSATQSGQGHTDSPFKASEALLST
jgi:hypothetical protein